MLRFYRVFGERVWLLLWYCQKKGLTFNDIAAASGGENEASPFMRHWDAANSEGSLNAGRIAEMQQDLEDQLGSSGEHQDGQLLNLVIEALNSPYARNILGGETLTNLRRGILLPEELAQAAERIQAAEMHCSRCGHFFSEKEVGTFQRNSRSWVCTRCQLPTYVACSIPSCLNSWVKIPAKLMAWLQKDHVCEQHTVQATPASPEVAQPSPGPLLGVVDRHLVEEYYSGRLVTSDPARRIQWNAPLADEPLRVTATRTAPPASGHAVEYVARPSSESSISRRQRLYNEARVEAALLMESERALHRRGIPTPFDDDVEG